MESEDIRMLLDNYVGLVEVKQSKYGVTFSGPIYFEASYETFDSISDTFEIEMFVPHDFPIHMPQVWEKGNRISKDFEHVNQDGTFCLAVPLEERLIFDQTPSLLGFVDNLLVPYLYGYSYWEKYGEMPFGEHSHGIDGILEYYMGLYETMDKVSVLKGIGSLLIDGYRPHEKCPCGSGKKSLKCHVQVSKSIARSPYKNQMISDISHILKSLEGVSCKLTKT